jgi:hypothetical protein
MNCGFCGNHIRAHERNCPVCDTDAGYPNVRAAEAAEERAALAERNSAADRGCAADGRSSILAQFRTAVKASKAVLCRSVSQTLKLISTDNELYTSFYLEVEAEARRPEETLVENDRLIADDLLFPHYRHHIRFAALSLNGWGVRQYGKCSITLADLAIAHRSTVFEKNSLEFCREFKLGAGTGIPPGYRASWTDREKLASAKLHRQLRLTDIERTFERRLLRDMPGIAPPDFIEVHIYGPVQRRGVEEIRVPDDVTPAEEAIILEIERRATEVGAEVIRDGS